MTVGVGADVRHGGRVEIRVALFAAFVVAAVALSPLSSATLLGPRHPLAAPDPGAARPIGAPAASILLAGPPLSAPIRGPPAPIHPSAPVRPQWWNVSGESALDPPPTGAVQGTWDAQDKAILYVGPGFNGYTYNGTWLFADGEWTQLSTPVSPGEPTAYGLAWDNSANDAVLFGGVNISTGNVNPANLTYTFADGQWTVHHLTTAPPAVFGCSMAYDPLLGGVVLFGGSNSGGTPQNEFWLFKNGAWSQVVAGGTAPSVIYPAMTFDPALQALVVYGGFDAFSDPLNETYTFANGSWTQVHTIGTGAPGVGAGYLAWDPDLSALILDGGLDQFGNPEIGAWQFNGSVWSVLLTTNTPAGHLGGLGVWDPLDHELVEAAGDTSSPVTTDVLSIPLYATNVTGVNQTDVGLWVTFNASALGGATPHQFSWSWGDGTANNNTESASHRYTAPQSYVVTLTVRGPTSNSIQVTRGIDVVALPVPTIARNVSGLDAGVPVGFHGAATGGWGPYVFSWSTSDSAGAAGPWLNHTFAQADSFLVNLTVLDSVGGTVTTSSTVLVNATPSVGIAPTNAPEVGTPTGFQAATTGGSGPYTYDWTFPSGPPVSGVAPHFRFPTAGAQSVTVLVTDADGLNATATITVQVVPPPTVAISGPQSAAAGASPTFDAVVSGGTEPYQIVWNLSDGSSANGTSATFSFTVAGTYEITVHVIDENLAAATAYFNVTVNDATSSTFGGTIAGVPTLALVAIVVVVALIGLWVALRGRGGGEESPPPAPPPEEPAPESDEASAEPVAEGEGAPP